MKESFSTGWLIFRKDVLFHRGALLVWALVLILPVVLRLTGWAEHVWGQRRGIATSDNILGILDLIFFLMVFVLPTALVMEDSPGRQERFLNSRPVTRGAVWLGKAFFIVLMVVLPVICQELVLGLLHPAGVSGLALFERGLIVMGFVVPLAAVASLWPSGARCLIGVGIIASALVLSMQLLKGFSMFEAEIRWFQRGGRNLWPIVPQLGFVLAVMAWWMGQWQIRSPGRRIGSSVLLGVIGAGVIALTPWRGVLKKPLDQELLAREWEQRVEEKTDRWALTTVKMVHREGEKHPALGANLSLAPLTLPNDWNLSWRVDRRTATIDGEPLHIQQIEPNLSFINQQRSQEEAGLAPVLRAHLGEDVMFHTWRSSPFIDHSVSMSVPEGSLDQAMRLGAEIVGEAHSWRMIGNVPLRGGETVVDRGRRWRVAGVDREGGLRSQYDNRWSFGLRCEALSRPLKAATPRFTYLVYVPESQFVMTLDFRRQGFKAPAFSAMGVQWGTLMPHHNSRLEVLPEDARLIICEALYRGRIEDRWQSPVIVPSRHRPHEGWDPNIDSAEELDENALAEVLTEIVPPSVTGTTSEVAKYVNAMLDLADRGQAIPSPTHGVVVKLKDYVPNYAEIFFRGLRVSGSNARRTLIYAMIEGLTETQKDLVIDALAEDAYLTQVVVARGWTKEAKAQLLYHLETGQHSKLLVGAVASLEDPETIPFLMRALELEPSYGRLLLKAPLFETLARKRLADLYEHGRGRLSNSGGRQSLIQLAAAQGDRSSIEELHRIAGAVKRGTSEWNRWQTTVRKIVMASSRDVDWRTLFENRPVGDFVWNPLTQKFELRP